MQEQLHIRPSSAMYNQYTTPGPLRHWRLGSFLVGATVKSCNERGRGREGGISLQNYVLVLVTMATDPGVPCRQ